MVSSWKAAETGIVQVPRSCDGSVRAARPLAIFSLGDLETLRSRRVVRIDPGQRSFPFLRGTRQRGSIDVGTFDLNRYPRGKDLAHTFGPEAV
jgi:hypothetical protein